MNAPLFIHPERALALRLGLPLEKIRAVRADGFVRGTDWQREGNEIRYSEPGVAKLTAALGLATETAATPSPELQDGRAGLCRALMTRADRRPEESSPVEPPEKNSAPNDPPEPGSAPAAAALPGEERRLVVLRTYTLNRRIVLARDGDCQVRVRMRDSSKLTPGMTMRCVFVEADLWTLNQRLPRHRGRW